MRDMTIRGAVTETRGVRIAFTTNDSNALLLVVDGKTYDIAPSDALRLPEIVNQWLHDYQIRRVVYEVVGNGDD